MIMINVDRLNFVAIIDKAANINQYALSYSLSLYYSVTILLLLLSLIIIAVTLMKKLNLKEI